MAATSRRVSYILPSPNDQPPLLSLPPLGHARRGQTSPSIILKGNSTNSDPTSPNGSSFQSKNPFLTSPTPPPGDTSSDGPGTNHPRHCLGVTSLALDTSTVLTNAQSPGGILYTGGRDGLVASWELNVPHRRRKGGKYEHAAGRGQRVKWERIGDGAEFWDEEEDDETSGEEDNSQGWDGVNGANGQGAGRTGGEVAYEDRWEVDPELLTRSKPKTAFRQSAQTHTDWVNAMLLCNLNQTVITASSDRTIRAWNPHASDATALAPAMVGRHRDYVKALTWAKYPSLLFSGALDRTLSVWDIAAQQVDPIFSIDLSKTADMDGVAMDGDRGSVYALGVDPAGKVLAAGTPEPVIRLWDPRAGDQSIGKLIGHSDCVRSIIFSEDGRYMLTGSSDTTIKLWSLAAHRCLHTFNHHDSSVWALHSNHPNLERFYSGSRDGYLTVTDIEGCTDMSDGECVVLSREGNLDSESRSGDEGIRSIVSMDDEYVWTATGSTDVQRWRDVGRRISRLDKDLDGSSYGRSAYAPLSGHGLEPAFQPTPITAGQRYAIEANASEQQGLLLRTESRDSRTVAFAPTPSPRPGQDAQDSPGQDTSNSPSAATARDRLSLPQTRHRALSNGSYAGSFMSDVSSNPGDGVNGTSGDDDVLHGLPLDSLVCLGIPESPYSFGFGDDAAPHRPTSIMSGSVPPPEEGSAAVDGQEAENEPQLNGHQRRVSIQIDHQQPHPTRAHRSRARAEYEERELASDAKPLRTVPDETIAGRPGLVRSLMLNDRQHVLTVDTEGEVAVWNIIRGICVGRFCADDVAAALHLDRGVKAETAVRKHSTEVLELVKERVEGETMVITWCQVDTKIGSLVVHLEEGRVFDAEVYADELNIPGMESASQDARINLGKWALANLFKGLIVAEERVVRASSPEQATQPLPSSSPNQITITRAPQAAPHRERAMSGTFTEPKTVSLNNIPGLVSPAATKAVLPDVESPLGRTQSHIAPSISGLLKPGNGNGGGGPLSAIAQSPSSVGGSIPAQSPGDALTRGDYFSQKRKPDPSPERGTTAATPGAALGSSVPQTPGGSFMGKFKGFGKKKATENMAPVVEAAPEPVEDKGPKFTEREQAQLNILDIVRSHPFHPPARWEAPPLALAPNTSLLISEEAKDAGAWVVTYRSQVSSTETDMESLEMNSPLWLLDYLFTSRVKLKEPVKLTFILEPAPGSEMKEMPEGTTRLSASRVLRARKIMAFIFDKLELGIRGRSGSIVSVHSRITPTPKFSATLPAADGADAGSGDAAAEATPAPPAPIAPEDVIELLCGPELVDPKITLATLKHYYGGGGDMLLHYRLKEGVSVAK